MQSKKLMTIMTGVDSSVTFRVTVNTSFTAGGMKECSYSIDSACVTHGKSNTEMPIALAVEQTGLSMDEIMERIEKL